MKLKFTLSLILALFVCVLKAQTPYVKMLKEDTTTWQHWGILHGVEPNRSQIATPQVGQNSYAAIDTITINGIKYKKFYQLNTNLNYNFKTLTGYLREDTTARKVFYRSTLTSSDEVLYDFSKNVNDSIYITFPMFSSNSGYYRVDSIVTRTITVGPRKHFYYRKHVGNFNQTTNYYEMIEGIGSTYHVAYLYGGMPYSWSFPVSITCKPKWEFGLTCKHDDLMKQYQSCVMTNTSSAFYLINSNDLCQFYYFVPGGLKTNDLEQLVKIGPSPADDVLHIQIESSFQQKELIISDISGKEIFNSNSPSVYISSNLINIKTSGLANGVYLLQLKLNDKKISRPILIQH